MSPLVSDAPEPGELAPLPPLWQPFVEVPVRLVATVIREPRDHCVNCRHRRVLYRLSVSSGVAADKTEARCAPCWGLR